jgi:hypothetical protein
MHAAHSEHTRSPRRTTHDETRTSIAHESHSVLSPDIVPLFPARIFFLFVSPTCRGATQKSSVAAWGEPVQLVRAKASAASASTTAWRAHRPPERQVRVERHVDVSSRPEGPVGESRDLARVPRDSTAPDASINVGALF